MDLSVDIDWQAFCNLLNDGGVARGIGNFDPSPLPDEMFDDDCSFSWDGGKITVHFKGEGNADFYQTEVKIAFEDGSVLYGATSGVEENYPFIKSALGFKGDLSDNDCKFALPVPLLMCNLWY